MEATLPYFSVAYVQRATFQILSRVVVCSVFTKYV